MTRVGIDWSGNMATDHSCKLFRDGRTVRSHFCLQMTFSYSEKSEI